MNSKINHIIKLGGSVLTGKGESPSFDHANTIRIIKELSPFYRKAVFVHGTGNYGKPPAVKYGYYTSGIITRKNRQIALKVKYSLRQLNQKVLRLFHSANIPAVTFETNSFYDQKNFRVDENQLRDFLLDLTNREILPIFYGDLVLLPNGDYKVLSSDDIVYTLTKIIQPESVIFLSDVDGVYLDNTESNNGSELNITHELNSINIHYLHRDSQDSKDVSGGMSKKAYISLETSKHCKNCFIGNGYTPGTLRDFINGEKVYGTYVKFSSSS
jgi:isopentenyl phosphate kinase